MSTGRGTGSAYLNRSNSPPLTVSELSSTCASPGCSNPVDRTGSGGYNRRYCSKPCKQRANRPVKGGGIEGGTKSSYSQTATVRFGEELSSAEGIASTKRLAGEAAIRNAAGRLGRTPDEVELLSISSPDSIYRDLARTASDVDVERELDADAIERLAS